LELQRREEHILVCLGGILEGREDVRFRSTFDSIDEVGNLREEGVVILFISTRKEKREMTYGE